MKTPLDATDAGRGHAVPLPKHAAKMGQAVEARVHGDFGDRALKADRQLKLLSATRCGPD
jgi:hypothetical protein